MKTTHHFSPDGSVERTVSEQHRYVLHPPLKVRLERDQDDGTNVALINNKRTEITYSGVRFDAPVSDDPFEPGPSSTPRTE